MKKFLRILWIFIVFVATFLVIKTQTIRLSWTEKLTTTLANPASVYCEQQSGTLEIVTDASGWQSWICHVVNRTTCEERAYFRGECGGTWTNQITGSIDQNNIAVSFERWRFFMVPKNNSWVSQIHIFDKTNLSKPYRIVSLPRKNEWTYTIRANQKPVFFNTTWIYIVAYLQWDWAVPPNSEYVVFEISYSGDVRQVASLGTYADMPIGDNMLIDNVNKKIVRLAWYEGKYTSASIKSFNIDTQQSNVFIYSHPPKKGMSISHILKVENNLVDLLIDRMEIDFVSKDAVVISVDVQANKVLSSIPYAKYKDSNPIQYKVCSMGESCPFTVNGKNMGVYTWVSFTTLMNDNILFGRYDSGSYVFIPINSIQAN